MDEHNCPGCKNPLSEVKQSHSQILNQYQFDAIKAGDYVCKSGCKGRRAKKNGWRYYWEYELNENF